MTPTYKIDLNTATLIQNHSGMGVENKRNGLTPTGKTLHKN